jgi:hypothetical protein
MKRISSEHVVLTRLCTADYKGRGIYKTTALEPSGLNKAELKA